MGKPTLFFQSFKINKMAKTILGKIIEAIKKANTVIETTESILPKPKVISKSLPKKSKK